MKIDKKETKARALICRFEVQGYDLRWNEIAERTELLVDQETFIQIARVTQPDRVEERRRPGMLFRDDVGQSDPIVETEVDGITVMTKPGGHELQELLSQLSDIYDMSGQHSIHIRIAA